MRDAAIETIIGHVEFEQTVFMVRWGNPDDRQRHHLLAWAQIRSMKTLSILFPEPGRSALLELEQHWDALDFEVRASAEAADQMSSHIESTRDDLLTVLDALE
ncbi:MAG: hypothetical protein AAGC71_06545 [Pseudomonadota bacterium]